MTDAERAMRVRESLPEGGLFAEQTWRIGSRPLELSKEMVRELEFLGRVFLQLYRAVNQLYRQSLDGRQPGWIAELLDQGKPATLIEMQRHPRFRNDVPRVIRPDLLLTEAGFALTELDSVPGGIGLTHWLNEVYGALPGGERVVGGLDGMRSGFEGIFPATGRVWIVVSEESASYRPEMQWLAGRMPGERFRVCSSDEAGMADGDSVYRFFELFDLANVRGADRILERALDGGLTLTPPPKPILEEKLLSGLLWNRNLREFWRKALGDGFFERLLRCTPQTWILDPTPLPPHGAYPGLDLTDWQQLKGLSQRDRDLILKISGFSASAWGARGVSLGSDLSAVDWCEAVDKALASWPASPHILQRYQHPKVVDSGYYDFDRGEMIAMKGRVRLCPYYFVVGSGDAARTRLGGILATICPADKKIIHGMRDAVLAPVAVAAGG